MLSNSTPPARLSVSLYAKAQAELKKAEKAVEEAEVALADTAKVRRRRRRCVRELDPGLKAESTHPGFKIWLVRIHSAFQFEPG